MKIVDNVKQNFYLEIPGEPISGSQLKFNRATGFAYRPTQHQQRVYTVNEYARRVLERRDIKRPMFGQGILLKLDVQFRFPHRKQDYGTGKNATKLKLSAPTYVQGRKDLDNLLKPLKDGMKGVVYTDDSQIVEYGLVSKVYSETPGTIIYLEEIE
jgi:Holliday junction resolvase RusA-like endonuclease